MNFTIYNVPKNHFFKNITNHIVSFQLLGCPKEQLITALENRTIDVRQEKVRILGTLTFFFFSNIFALWINSTLLIIIIT